MEVKMKKQARDFFSKPAFVYRLEDAKSELKWKCQRFKRGYADVDEWNINTWFVRTIIPMLHEMADNHFGHPTDLTDKQWTKVLNKMCNCFEEYYDDEKCQKKNPYEEEYRIAQENFLDAYGMFGDGLKTKEEKAKEEEEGSYRYYGLGDIPEYAPLVKKYFKEDRKIEAYKQKKLQEGLGLFVKYFNNLWD